MATSHQRFYNELCSCLVSSYLKHTSLVHVDVDGSKLLTRVEVQHYKKYNNLDTIICDGSFNLTAVVGRHFSFCVTPMYPAVP